MTRDDIIAMAQEADIYYRDIEDEFCEADKDGVPLEMMAKFAALVAAAERKWVGLTDEEFNDCLVAGDPCENLAEPEAWAVMKEVEAKLKEKNA